MKKRIAIFISGRGSNMQAIVDNVQNGILQDCCDVVLVFANKASAAGLEIAAQKGLQTSAIESKGKSREEFEYQVIELLKPLQIDFIVLAGFMRILSPVFVGAFKNRIINIHPADTAEFQGVGAYEWAFENKKEFTAVTVHFVDEGVDTGPVIAKQKVDLSGAASLQEVEKSGLAIEHSFYSEALRRVFSGEYKVKD